jgi:hypothetical protein
MNFYGRQLPREGRVAGYGWLVSTLNLKVPMPIRLAFVSDQIIHHKPLPTYGLGEHRSRSASCTTQLEVRTGSALEGEVHQFKSSIDAILDMPTRSVELLRSFLNQGNGKLPKRAMSKEFSALTPQEVEHVEDAYARAWGD